MTKSGCWQSSVTLSWPADGTPLAIVPQALTHTCWPWKPSLLGTPALPLGCLLPCCCLLIKDLQPPLLVAIVVVKLRGAAGSLAHTCRGGGGQHGHSRGKRGQGQKSAHFVMFLLLRCTVTRSEAQQTVNNSPEVHSNL